MFDQVTAAKERILKRYIYGQKVIDINRQLLKLFSFLITISYSDELDFQIDCFNILKWKMYETHKIKVIHEKVNAFYRTSLEN